MHCDGVKVKEGNCIVEIAFIWLFAWRVTPFLEIRVNKTQIENHSFTGLRSQVVEFGAAKMAEKWQEHPTQEKAQREPQNLHINFAQILTNPWRVHA